MFLILLKLLLISTVINATLKIPISNSDYVDSNDVLDKTDYFYDELEDEPMRVVDTCRGLDEIVLRFATYDEELTLEKQLGHIMDGYKYRVQGITKSPILFSYDETTIGTIKTKLETTMNDFMLSLLLDADVDSPDIAKDNTDILIYYRSYIEVLVIRSAQKQWNYVLGSHSTLPEWFYENDVTDKRDIPEKIKNHFFILFMRKIKTLSNNLHL